MSNPFLAAALQYLAAGLFPIPINSKRKPLIAWKQFKDGPLPAETQVIMWFSHPAVAGIAILTGKASGGLLGLDFDTKNSSDPQLYGLFIYNLIANGFPTDMLRLIPTVCTRSGGGHWYIRCNNPGTNKVLAHSEKGSPVIETRGEGGLLFAPPTPGYSFIGNVLFFPFLEDNEVQIILNTSAEFDLKPQPAPPPLIVKQTYYQPNYHRRRNFYQSPEDVFARCVEKTLYKGTFFVDGNRNKFVFGLSCRCRNRGLSEEFTLSNCLNRFIAPGFEADEIKNTVHSAYKYISL